MATQSRRGRILENLKRQLETITAANGYVRDVQRVTFDLENFSDTPQAQTPVIYIVDETTTYSYHAGRTLEHDWQIGLFLVMREFSQMELEETLSDMEQCLFSNITLSFDGTIPGPVSHMRVSNIITDGQLFARDRTTLAKMTISVKYTTCINDTR